MTCQTCERFEACKESARAREDWKYLKALEQQHAAHNREWHRQPQRVTIDRTALRAAFGKVGER